MAPRTGLEDLHARLQDARPFFRRIMEDVGFQAVRILQENSPGTRLPQEWTFNYHVDHDGGECRIYHTRLENDRDVWEIIFHYHNSGTRRHWVAPVIAAALHWIDPDSGEDRFSKGHFVEGVPARHFAELTDRFLSDYQRTLRAKWQRWVNTGILP